MFKKNKVDEALNTQIDAGNLVKKITSNYSYYLSLKKISFIKKKIQEKIGKEI
jgi:hypothetical protein